MKSLLACTYFLLFLFNECTLNIIFIFYILIPEFLGYFFLAYQNFLSKRKYQGNGLKLISGIINER